MGALESDLEPKRVVLGSPNRSKLPRPVTQPIRNTVLSSSEKGCILARQGCKGAGPWTSLQL